MSGSETQSVGQWRQVAVVVDGRRIPVGTGAVLTVDAQGYSVSVAGRVIQRGTSSNDYATVPHQSDVTVTEGPQAGQTLPQIFHVEGDILMACAAPNGGVRPTEFRSPSGSGHVLSIWLRISPADAVPGAWSTHSWKTWLVALFALDVSQGLRRDLIAHLGYWGGLIAEGLIASAMVMLAGRLLKWSWRSGLVLGLTMSIGLNTFQELRTALEPALGAPGSLAVSASTAFVAALLAGVALSRLIKAQWD